MNLQLKRFDFLVFIARFQPVHDGHLYVIKKAFALSKSLIILIGSAYQARSTRNPWNVTEREQMIRGALSEKENENLYITPLMDMIYNDEGWIRSVQATVEDLITVHHHEAGRGARIGVIGSSNAKSSFYRNHFSHWQFISIDSIESVSGTFLRNEYFEKTVLPELWAKRLPSNVRSDLSVFRKTSMYLELKNEHEFILKYRRAWENAPYVPIFTTVDAIVVHRGNILLVERKLSPGKGLVALPGGFLDPDERLVEACLRELKEETHLKISVVMLKNSIKRVNVFDDPYRSQRGRFITHVFFIELLQSIPIPEVMGGDDAKKAFWIPISDLESSRFFEDHYFIIKKMIGH